MNSATTEAAASDSGGEGSSFEEMMEARAARRGVSLDELYRIERDPAKSRMLCTVDCLYPLEVELILSSPDVRMVGNRIETGASTDAHVLELVSHVRSCSFCSTLVRVAKPTDRERERVMDRVRIAASSQRHLSLRDFENEGLIARITSYWPIAVITGLGAYLTTMGLSQNVRPFYWQALASCAIPAFCVAVIGLCVGMYYKKHSSNVSHVSNAFIRRFGTTHSALFRTLTAVIPAVVFLLPAAFLVDRGVNNAQGELTTALSTPNPAQPSPGMLKVSQLSVHQCDQKLNDVVQTYCAGNPFLPGEIKLSVKDGKGEVFWDVYGKRVREFKVEQGTFALSASGKPTIPEVTLASGKTLPVNDLGGKSYDPGTAVLALSDNVVAQRVAQDLKNVRGDRSTAPMVFISKVSSLEPIEK